MTCQQVFPRIFVVLLRQTGLAAAIGLATMGLTTMGLATVAYSQTLELEGFTEPYRTISIAADESGIIEDLMVREGDQVALGQPVARLNSDVHTALLAIAKQNMISSGRLDAARAELQLRKERLVKLSLLREDGNARQEEVDRATAEVSVAEANVLSAREERLTRRLEYDKVNTQIQRRTIRSPIDGVVTSLHKDQGEFVAPNSPDVLTIVQLDPLLANFTMTSLDAKQLKKGQRLQVRFITHRKLADGVVDFISPVTDAESGTVRLKVRIPNQDGRFRSGERCKIRLEK